MILNGGMVCCRLRVMITRHSGYLARTDNGGLFLLMTLFKEVTA